MKMAAQVNSALQWPEALSLDRRNANTFLHRQVNDIKSKDEREKSNHHPQIHPDDSSQRSSFLYSARLRQNISESRRAFLTPAESTAEPAQKNNAISKTNSDCPTEQSRPATAKKISFKIKKTSSIYRRTHVPHKMTSISATTVAQLASKFNQMVAQNKTILEEPKVVKVRKTNSYVGANRTDRKPSVKRKPTELTNITKFRSAKNTSIKKDDSDNKTCVRAKIGYLETPQTVSVKEEEDEKPKLENVMGNVKATIEIFERRTSLPSPSADCQKEVPILVPKPKVPEKNFTVKAKIVKIKNSDIKLKIFSKETPVIIDETPPSTKTQCNENEKQKTDEIEEENVQVLAISPTLPQRKCDSMYETLNLKRTLPPAKLKATKSADAINSMSMTSVIPTIENLIQPNASFLWRRSANDNQPSYQELEFEKPPEIKESDYDVVIAAAPDVPPRPTTLALSRPVTKKKMPLPTEEPEEKIYEELRGATTDDYDYCQSSKTKSQQEVDDGYEYCSSPLKENIYECLPAKAPPLLPRRQEEPLPPRPPSLRSASRNEEDVSNCYESIYNAERKDDTESNYESIYGCQIRSDNWSTGSNRDSLVSDQQSNSLYGRSLAGWIEDVGNAYNGKAASELSSSDQSDEWVDLSENEDGEKRNQEVIIVRERQRNRKPGWSQKLREQRNKLPTKTSVEQDADTDSDHHYESLYLAQEESQDDDFDSFDSDTESEKSLPVGAPSNGNGTDVPNTRLPEPPNNQAYVFTRLAATAGKHMKRLKSNWSVTKTDITKSLSRMTKRKSRTSLVLTENIQEEATNLRNQQDEATAYENMQFLHQVQESCDNIADKGKSTSRKGFLNKFRRSMSMTAETANELTQNLSKPKSTFYLTETINVDSDEKGELGSGNDSGFPSSPVHRNSRTSLTRPHSPPPPIPNQNIVELRKHDRKDKRSASWYTECGLFKNQEKRPNTYWYAEVGLYPSQTSTPSTSSAENSGTNLGTAILQPEIETVLEDSKENYYNVQDENNYYNQSIKSIEDVSWEMQLRLQDEPLYQFYDAAVLESVCQDTVSDFDSDGYEEVGDKSNEDLSSRPSAMDIVAPNRNSIALTRTLWCEIPEVINSSVLSTLNMHQMKLQEAKFEMITSEASYLNSLNVLVDHFIPHIGKCESITWEEKMILFDKIEPVKRCSEKLLLDLEKCWQDNILLHGICDIVQCHAEGNFDAYVSYCENQILLDSTLKKMKERPSFSELLHQLETSSACQSLTLYSFLMLPMQRITRWPLLIDAVLKRLSPQDDEYLTCQYALATMNKIVSQCNEGARKMEREAEMRKIASQLEFGKGVKPISIILTSRYLVRSGALTHMSLRNDETILTFGKRFTKSTLHLFLFNDLLLVTKFKSEDCYIVLHYCARNLVELTSTDTLLSLPLKDAQGKNLLFLTILENQDEKTCEFLFSCSSETDKERWLEALTPPKSEDPNETLYECWDCPQVTSVHSYVASQPDELSLNKGDIINVTRKMADGWYHGERIRDGEVGWFPANYTREIANPHVRARNLKQRYRLLAFSENYLKSKSDSSI